MRISVGLRSGNSQLAVGLNGGDASLGVNFGSVRVVSAACHFPPGGNVGDIIVKQSPEDFDAMWTPPADTLEMGNKLPVTASAVYEAMSEIDMTLATIAQINRLF